jgi:hypothetical protein
MMNARVCCVVLAVLFLIGLSKASAQSMSDASHPPFPNFRASQAFRKFHHFLFSFWDAPHHRNILRKQPL